MEKIEELIEDIKIKIVILSKTSKYTKEKINNTTKSLIKINDDNICIKCDRQCEYFDYTKKIYLCWNHAVL